MNCSPDDFDKSTFQFQASNMANRLLLFVIGRKFEVDLVHFINARLYFKAKLREPIEHNKLFRKLDSLSHYQ